MTAERLGRLPELYLRSESILVHQPRQGLERTRGGLPRGITLDETVVSARTEIVTVLASWAALVVEERPVPTGRPARRATALAAFLLRHLDWLGTHPAAGDLVTEIAGLTRTATAAVGPEPLARRAIGPCRMPGCGATVYAVFGDLAGLPNSRVSCEAGHVVRPSDWLGLSRGQGQAR